MNSRRDALKEHRKSLPADHRVAEALESIADNLAEVRGDLKQIMMAMTRPDRSSGIRR